MINTVKKREILSIRQTDPDFFLNDGTIRYPRAMMHVTPECPRDIADLIATAVERGWLKCVAHVKGKELTWEKLTND